MGGVVLTFIKLPHNCIWCFSFALILGSTATLSGCKKKEEPKAKEIIRSIKTFTVKKRASGQVRKFSGSIQASDVTPLSFRISGLVQKVNVKFGDSVKKGQILAVLDETPLILKVKEKSGELQKTIAIVNERKINLKRQKKLLDDGITSRTVFDSAKSDFETSRSSVDVAEATLRLAKRDLSYTVLRSPYSGNVAKRIVEPFQEIRRGQAIFEIQRGGSLEVATSIPETLIRFVSKGKRVMVSFPSQGNLSVSGQIIKISTKSESANTFPVNIKLFNPPKTLRPGMTAETIFHFDPHKGQTAFLVPLSAYLEQASDKKSGYFFVYDPKSSTVKKTLIRGRNIRDNFIEIYEGIKAGDIIVVAGVHFLRDGQKVKLLSNQKIQ